MSYTKRELINGAMAEIGLAEYTFDLSSEQLDQALRRLDSMMAEWNARGIRLSYPIPATPGSSVIDDNSAVPDSAYEAIITNLAVKMAPAYGKTVSIDTKASARHALNTLMAKAAMPQEMQITGLPMGAGNKNIDEPFLPPAVDPLEVGPDGPLEFN